MKKKCLEEEQRLGELTTDKKLMEATLFGLRKELGVGMNSQSSDEEKHVCESRRLRKQRPAIRRSGRKTSWRRKSLVESNMMGLRMDMALSSEISKLGKRNREVEKARLDLDNITEQLVKEKEKLAAANANENLLNEESRRKKEEGGFGVEGDVWR